MIRAHKPDWLKTRPPSGEQFTEIKRTLRERMAFWDEFTGACPDGDK